MKILPIHEDADQQGKVADPEVPAKARRRRFTKSYKLEILEEADRCGRPGELGALMRREGLYWSHLSKWRQQRDQGQLESLSARKSTQTKGQAGPRRIRELEARNRKLQRDLDQARTIIDVQKKLSEMLGLTTDPHSRSSS